MARAFNVETRFEGMVMIHVISKDVRVITDLSTMDSTLFINERETKKTNCTGMTLSSYKNYLAQIAETTLNAKG